MRRSRGVDRAVNAADGRIEALADAFSGSLNQILMQAQARTLAVLQNGLDFDRRGRVSNSAANRKILTSIRQVFVNEMNGAGYDNLVRAFLGEWPSIAPLFQDTVNAIFAEWKEPPPSIDFTLDDLQLAVKGTAATRAELRALLGQYAFQAQTKALFSVNAMSFSDLIGILAKYTGQTLPQARSTAATATATYYRTLSNQGWEQIEAERGPLLYTYEGPDDTLTRPFCKRVLAARRPFTRAEIEGKLENWTGHSLPNVMVTCGGYNCRHQWVPVLGPSLKKKPKRQV